MVRDEAEGVRNVRTQRAVAGDDERHPFRRRHEVEHTLLRRQPADVQDPWRRRLVAPVDGHVDAARDHAHLPRAELPRVLGERARRADHQPCAPHDRARKRPHAPCELHVRPPQLQNERLARRERDKPGREPMGMQEVGVPRRPARRGGEGREHERQSEDALRAQAQVPDDPRTVGDAVVTEGRRGHDLDVRARGAQVLHRVRNKASRRVPGEARVRRRKDGDLHERCATRIAAAGRGRRSGVRRPGRPPGTGGSPCLRTGSGQRSARAAERRPASV